MDGRYEQTTIERLERGWISRVVSLVLSFLLPLTTMPTMAWALPHGGMVTKGIATLSYSTSKLLVTQSTSSASYSWSSYNVGSSQSVTYKTPGGKSVSMNYIGGTTPALISGKVTSNGILYFMDANGIVFGQGSEISAAGVRAYGAISPSAPPAAAVTNAGTLSVAPGGEVVLVGTSVANSGTIAAPGGEVVMASGKMVTLSQTSGSSFSVMTTGGGSVDDSGVVSAETVGGKTGTVILQAGMQTGGVALDASAVVDASAPNGGNGGQVFINASGVVLNDAEPINVSAPYGTKGTVRIDPNYTLWGTTLDICNATGLEYLDGNQSSYLSDKIVIVLESNMNLATGSTPYNWIPLGNSSNQFTGTFNGNGYTVSGYTIGMSGSKYSGNDVGFIGYLGSGATVENLGVSGTIYASGSYVGGVVGFNNTGTVETSYNTGSVSGTDFVGGVVGWGCSGTVKTSYNTGSVSGSSYVGGVVGYNFGTVETSYNTGSVSGSVSGSSDVGGVVGFNCGTVETSYNTGSVSGSSDVGGVVGGNCANGTVETSYNTGSVSGSSDVGGVVGFNGGAGAVEYSYNTGSVSGSSDVGGVVGDNTSAATACDNYFLKSSSSYALGNSTSSSSSSSSSTNVGLLSFSTTNPTKTFPKWSTLFNTWSSGTFQSSATSAPWFEGSVVSGSGTITAPMLVPDLATATVTGNGSSVYNGKTVTNAYTTTYTMGGTMLSPNVTVTTAVGPNAGTYKNTPTYSISAPTTQTSVDSVSAVCGTWTITPATLTAVTSASKVYDGTTSLTLMSSNTTFKGLVDGQTATLHTNLTGTLNSANVGSNLGGTLNKGYDLTGNPTFCSALGKGDYLVSPNFTGGSILSLSSSAIVPAAQTSSANISLLSAPTGLNGVAFQAGSPATSLPTLAFLPSGNFGSAPTGGLNLGDLTEDTMAIFDVNSVNVSFPSTSGDETILAVGLRDIQPVDTISLKENTQSASPSSPRTLDLLTLSGSSADSYSLRIPAFRPPSDNGVFESQEER